MSFDTTDLLGLPCIMPAQAQKHVTHNEALRRLDALVHLAVASGDLAAPPPEPAPGERHIVAAGATGLWAGHDGEIAAWLDGAWSFSRPNRAGAPGTRTSSGCGSTPVAAGATSRPIPNRRRNSASTPVPTR